MAARNWDQCFRLVLKHEGGYVNNNLDPGGMTNLGVTKRVWEEFVGHRVDEADMRSLTPDMVKPLYKRMYWDKIRGDSLPLGVDYATYDFAVNSGVERAAKMLQTVVGASPDGVIGPKTLAEVGSLPPADVIRSLCAAREAFLQSLKTWPVFGKGWGRRVNDVSRKAVEMTKAPVT